MKRATPSRRPKAAKRYAIIGIKVPNPTRAQIGKLKKLFHAKGVATLGVAPTLVAQKQQYQSTSARRKPRRR